MKQLIVIRNREVESQRQRRTFSSTETRGRSESWYDGVDKAFTAFVVNRNTRVGGSHVTHCKVSYGGGACKVDNLQQGLLPNAHLRPSDKNNQKIQQIKPGWKHRVHYG